ncbi:creatininase family protein [Streptomyces sp. NPDC059835]|uniref:creatininase family protein n=1 Tax=Streptomyces sp. NPDC059835 TaxID=3346967 RepID=UPI0036614261
MTWPDLAPATDGFAVVPVGALEPHGPHLPLGSDTMISEHFARGAAHREVLEHAAGRLPRRPEPRPARRRAVRPTRR